MNTYRVFLPHPSPTPHRPLRPWMTFAVMSHMTVNNIEDFMQLVIFLECNDVWCVTLNNIGGFMHGVTGKVGEGDLIHKPFSVIHSHV